MTVARILHGDILRFAYHYKGEPFHALICDAPYHLTTITKRFGKENSAPAQYGTDGAYARASAGFMGQGWDGGDVAFRPETWEAIGNLLYPGAFCMAFGGSRTAHRMAVAIEDAGFIIHPQISWLYGSGFPKATNISKQLDKSEGIEIKKGELISDNVSMTGGNYTRHKYEAQTDLAQTWEGHRYGMQTLKPASEPIIVFQKPYEGRPVDNIVEHGAGALNIDGGRIGTQDSLGGSGSTTKVSKGWDRPFRHNPDAIEHHKKLTKEKIAHAETTGRWPANVVLSHTPDCKIVGHKDDTYAINRFTNGAKPFGDGAGHEFESESVEGRVAIYECVEGCPVRALDQQSGHLIGAGNKPGSQRKGKSTFGQTEQQHINMKYDNGGSASRFFYQSDWAIEQADPFYYEAKSAGVEKEAGLRGHLHCLICGQIDTENHINDEGVVVKCKRNSHPTLKPIALIKHLATLLLPPDTYAPRRILVPFAGTASEMIGCYLAGWEHIIGVELTAEYIPIANARIRHWLAMGRQLDLF